MIMLSIIIPLYNSSTVIETLINNLKNQTCKNFEVLFIDDCSKDDSYKKAVAYIKNSNLNFKIFRNKENKGPGISRNICIEHAAGQYITFLDSDDKFDKKTVEIISNVIDVVQNPDAILFDFYMVFNNKKIKCDTVMKQAEGFITPEQAILYSTSATWCKVYKRDIIQKSSLRFPDMRIKEDFVFNKLVMANCHTIFYKKVYLYEYIINHSSIMHTAKIVDNKNEKKAFEIIDKELGNQFNDVILKLKIREYLTAVVQNMIRGKKKQQIYQKFYI